MKKVFEELAWAALHDAPCAVIAAILLGAMLFVLAILAGQLLGP